MRTISQMREMFSVAPLLNQQMPRRCFVTSERGWFCQILAEPSFQFVQFFGVGAGDVSPLQGSCCCLKDSLLHLTIPVLAADEETDVFAFFQWIVPLEDETFVVGLDESEASGKAGKHGAQAATDDLFESLDKREFCVVKRGILADRRGRRSRKPWLRIMQGCCSGGGQPLKGPSWVVVMAPLKRYPDTESWSAD